MKHRNLRYIISVLLAVFLAFSLTACGSGGGGGGSDSTPSDSPTSNSNPVTVSGVAATGAPVSGNVYLKDANGTEIGPVPIAADGSYSFDVTGLTAPFFLCAVDNNGDKLYSVSMGAGIANINPFTNLTIAAAAGVDDPAGVYDALINLSEADINQALNDLRNIFLAMLWAYDADVNPFTDLFNADHTGLDALFDNVNFDIVGGIVFFTDNQSNPLGQVYVSNLQNSSNDNIQVSGSAFNEPASGFLARLSLNVDESSLGTGQLSYAYQQAFFSSTSITSISSALGSISITGEMEANGLAGYTFTAVISDLNPDSMGMEIRKPDGSVLLSNVLQTVTSGDFIVTSN